MMFAGKDLEDEDVRRISELMFAQRHDIRRYFQDRYDFTRSEAECLINKINEMMFASNDVCADEILGWYA